MSTEGGTVLARQFDDWRQQVEASSLGMWAFLVSEMMLFGGLFLGYTVYRLAYPDAFAIGSHHLDLVLGTLNTVVLLASSLTMVLAVQAAHASRPKRLVCLLGTTALLGLVFLGIKAIEYRHTVSEGLMPGAAFSLTGNHAAHIQLFFSLYLAMTGMHALHLSVGVALLTVLLVLAARGRFSADYYAPVEITGLYWHFVAIVWIFQFPLLYLIGRH